MEGIFDSGIFATNWFRYGMILVVIIPILAVVFNELLYSLNNKGQHELIKPVKSFRNIILPLIALIIVFTKVLDLGRDATLLKILETVVWIIAINAVLAILNVLLFRRKSQIFKNKTPQLFLDIFRVTMVLFGSAIILSTVWGQDLGGMITALGLGSFVLGLALQDTLGNLFSGIALVYEKPFEEGDWIVVGDQIGKVVEMNWRAIRLETREKELIIIPHLVIGQGVIRNYSKPSRIHVLKKLVGFSYDSAPNLVKEALIATCKATPGIVMKPEPEIKVDDYGDSKVNYEIEFAISDYKDHEEIMDDFMSRIWYTAKRYNIHMPYPQMTIHNSVEIPPRETTLIEKLKSALSELPTLMPIERDNIRLLEDGSAIHYFGKGERIVSVGDETGDLYVILDGFAQMTSNNDDQLIHIANLQRGDFFGEITMFTSKTSSFNIEAISDLKVVKIFSDEVLELVEKNRKFAYFLDDTMDIRRDILKK